LVERYYGPEGPWPSLNTIRSIFGSFSAAREAAELPVNRPGPAKGRRTAGAHRPIRDIQTRVQTRVTDRSRALARELENTRHREAAGKAKIDQLTAEVRDLRRDARTPVVDETALRAVRARARDLSSDLSNTRRREDRARARVAELERRLAAAKRPEMRPQIRPNGRSCGTPISAKPAVIQELRHAVIPAHAVMPAVNAEDLARARADVDRLTRAVAAAERRAELARDARRDWDRERAMLRARAARTDAADERARAAVTAGRASDRRAQEAEQALRDLAEAVSGRRRRLTRDELQELRTTGPAGPAVLGDAIKQLAKARAGRGDLKVALTGVAEAALGWRDTVR
jgi:chromosome segregation ATPase